MHTNTLITSEDLLRKSIFKSADLTVKISMKKTVDPANKYCLFIQSLLYLIPLNSTVELHA